MNALAENFDLALGDDEEFAAIFAFDEKLVSQRNGLGFEATGHPRNDRIRQF